MRSIDGIKRHGRNPKDFELENPSFAVDIQNSDIQKGDKYTSQNEAVGLIAGEKPRKDRLKPREKTKMKTAELLIWLFLGSLLFAYSCWSGWDLIGSSKKISSNVEDIQTNLKYSLSSISNMNLGDGIKQLKEGFNGVHSTRLLIGKTGQDITLLEYWPQKPKITNKVLTLKIIDNSLKNLDGFMQGVSELDSPDFDCLGDCILDVKSLRIKLGDLNTGIDKSISNLTKNLDQVDFLQEKQILAMLAGEKFKQAKSFIENFGWLDGEKSPRKFLVIFQNNSELIGGSGGSFGSFATFDIEDGKIKKPDFGKNIYKLERESKEKIKIAPPETLYDGQMGIKESGISVDGKDALKNITYYYEKTTGEDLDGVIVINVTAVSKLFDITGPIFMADYGQEVNSSNLKDVLEEEVHTSYFQREGSAEENEPKKIIGEVMPIFMQRLIDNIKHGDKPELIMDIIRKSFQQKDLLIYLEKQELENIIEKNNLLAQISKNNNDYLHINNSNMWITKSSLSINEEARLKVTINDKGETSHSLDISRKHFGKDEFPDGLNYNFTRVLLPPDSRITNFNPIAGNYQIRAEFGYRNGKDVYWREEKYKKTQLNFWFSTDVGTESKVKIDYKTNYKVDTTKDTFDYIIDLQKQPGSLPDTIYLDITYPVAFSPENVSNLRQEGGRFILKTVLDQDKTIKIKFVKNEFAK